MSIKDNSKKVLNAAEFKRKITGDTLPDPKFMDICEDCDSSIERSLWNGMIVCDKCWVRIKRFILDTKQKIIRRVI